MVSKELFTLHWTAWCDRWSKTAPRDDATTRLFYEVVSQALTDEQFEQAAVAVFRDHEFFPSPKQVIDAGRDEEVAAAAVREWNVAVQPSSWEWTSDGTRNTFGFSRRGRFAWTALGGDATMRDLAPNEVAARREEFVKWYCSASIEAREALTITPALPPGPKERYIGRAYPHQQALVDAGLTDMVAGWALVWGSYKRGGIDSVPMGYPPLHTTNAKAAFRAVRGALAESPRNPPEGPDESLLRTWKDAWIGAGWEAHTP